MRLRKVRESSGNERGEGKKQYDNKYCITRNFTLLEMSRANLTRQGWMIARRCAIWGGTA